VIAKQPAVKRYIVTLSAEEREHLDTLIQKGTSPARQVLKARILLKSDASDAGDAWSDSQIATALDTSIDTVARTRQQLVEEGLEAALTRKHGSWLDMAESELSVLSVQCLDRRISDRQTLIEEVAAWQDCRNKKHTTADWHFTTADARVKLKRLYPAI
jgi:uncharacterized small protein (DUF1192 family)